MNVEEFYKLNDNERVDWLANAVLENLVKTEPEAATYLGIHTEDHRVSEQSTESYLERIKDLKTFLDLLSKIDVKKLNHEKEIDYESLKFALELELFNTDELRSWEKAPTGAWIAGDALFILFTRDFAPFEERIKSIISRIKQFPRVFEQDKERLKKPVKLWVENGLQSIEAIPMLFNEIVNAAKGKVSKETFDELISAIKDTEVKFKEYAEWLKEVAKTASNDWAIGPEKFAKLLKLRLIDYTPDEILKMGENYLKQFKEQLVEIAKEIDPNATVEEVDKRLSEDHPKTFEEVLQLYRESVKRAREWVIKSDFATIPEGDKFEVIPTPDYLIHILPFAAAIQPARFEKEKVGTYLVTPPKENPELLKAHEKAGIPNTTVHEAYPGHYLQGLAATFAPLARMFGNPVEYIEGWAHYCEQAVKEMGFDNTPEARFAQTKDLIWRAVRVIVDVKLSTGQMSYDEAVDYLVNEVKMQKASAIAEVNRYTTSPGYQLSYLLGKHMFLELREEIKKKLGDKYTPKFFHDTIIYSGAIPIKILRKVFDYKIKEMLK